MMYVDVVLSECILHAYFIQKKSANESAVRRQSQVGPFTGFQGELIGKRAISHRLIFFNMWEAPYINYLIHISAVFIGSVDEGC